MKNQYFGDINDYRKYGLLRSLCDRDTTVAVCWMLTSADGRPDGRKIKYLSQPTKWRAYDTGLFDALAQAATGQRTRDICCAENPNILSPSIFSFFKKSLRDDNPGRDNYFEEFLSSARHKDLVFFDPDNGLDVPSRPRGRKNSSKYLYRNELAATWEAQSSILFYQHFPFEERSRFIDRIARDLRNQMGPLEVVSFRTPNVAFFLLAQRPRHQHLLERASRIEQVWGEQIRVRFHR